MDGGDKELGEESEGEINSVPQRNLFHIYTKPQIGPEIKFLPMQIFSPSYGIADPLSPEFSSRPVNGSPESKVRTF